MFRPEKIDPDFCDSCGWHRGAHASGECPSVSVFDLITSGPHAPDSIGWAAEGPQD